MRQENEEVQYIWHDGVRIREEQLISMAKNAGSYAVAEHYIGSLLAHGVMYHLPDYMSKVNKLREFYGVAPIPTPMHDLDAVPKRRKNDIADKVRKLYWKMTDGEHLELLSDSLTTLRADHPNLFRFKYQWQGIYLVVRDRLDCGLSQTEFLVMAASATPDSWPERLRISASVIKNFCRGIKTDEDDEAYYELDDNPQRELCNTFWEILMQRIMMGKYGGNTEFV